MFCYYIYYMDSELFWDDEIIERRFSDIHLMLHQQRYADRHLFQGEKQK